MRAPKHRRNRRAEKAFMTINLDAEFGVIQTRLGETLESFTVIRKINELCNADCDPKFGDALNKRGGFWQATLVAHQTTHFVGLFALLDKGNDDSATLYSVLKELNTLRPGIAPAGLEAVLDAVRDKCKRFRHKLFGHNDRKRVAVVAQFNAAGLTWESMASDLEELEFVFKTLFEVWNRRPVPTEESARAMQFPYSQHVQRAGADTEALLTELAG
jgi:hypothetical protein